MVDESSGPEKEPGPWGVRGWTAVKDKFVLVAFMAVVSWSSQRLLTAYQGEGTTAAESRATIELRAQLIACRNRELDDVKARLLHMETAHP